MIHHSGRRKQSRVFDQVGAGMDERRMCSLKSASSPGSFILWASLIMAETTTTERWRLFLAISIPDEIKTQFERAQTDLRAAAMRAQIKWAPRDQLHLTLQFLGDVPAADVVPLVEAVRSVCKTFAPLELRAERIGFFPNPKRPRVAWVGVQNQQGRLQSLHRAVVMATLPFTVKQTRDQFSGHVTLGRIKSASRSEIQMLLKTAGGMADKIFGEWISNEVGVYRSQLSAEGAVHTLLAVAPCGAEA